MILLQGEGAGQASRSAGNILATEQLSQLGKLCAPSQFLENAAEKDKPNDVGGWRQGWDLRPQFGHPAEDVWIAAQLVERAYLGMSSAEVSQELADSPAVVTSRVGME